ncbi:putative transcription factor C3H family [Helianthus annuus]|uniref:Putative zinc finger, CCCH-type n=1 Tax=Helianthus annuus TaxID=4232 RepID=A0A251VAC0_HELAN|nr:putative transcription factor C3H family [Helianthus annuus]
MQVEETANGEDDGNSRRFTGDGKDVPVQTGYCQFGSNCIFAHGEAELQRHGGGEVHQRAIVQNLPARPTPSGPSAGHAVTAPAADAGGSRQMSSATQGPIPSRNAWKVPKKINGIYGDWINDSMP